MNNRLLAFAGLAVVGALVSVGSADTVINAYVQQFGATPHEVITPPGDVRNVQIDWSFPTLPGTNATDYNFIEDCSLLFDKPVPTGSTVICKLSGHDSDPMDGAITNGTAGPIIGFGSVVVTSPTRQVDVDVLCDPDVLNPTGNYTEICDIQDIDDVKVIVVGKETDVVTAEGPEVLCEDDIDNDGDGLIDSDDPDCTV